MEVEADPLTDLLDVNHESRETLKRRFTNPFSSRLREVGDDSGADYAEGEGSDSETTSSRSFPNLLIDLSRDTLSIFNQEMSAGVWDDEFEGEDDLPEFKLLYFFRYIFNENQDKVLQNLVKLKLCCHSDSFFGIDGLNPPPAPINIGIIKTHLPRLKELTFQCTCHCEMGRTACQWISRIKCEGVILDVQHCCHVAYLV